VAAEFHVGGQYSGPLSMEEWELFEVKKTLLRSHKQCRCVLERRLVFQGVCIGKYRSVTDC
jgi:hypothetical protein